jgi:hypothetical protein
MKTLITIVTMLFCTLATAGGSFLNAQALVTRLQMADPLAVGYIMGIADAEDGKTMCLPAGASHIGLAQTVMQSVPRGTVADSMYQPAHVFVSGILAKAYPCAKKS